MNDSILVLNSKILNINSFLKGFFFLNPLVPEFFLVFFLDPLVQELLIKILDLHFLIYRK